MILGTDRLLRPGGGVFQKSVVYENCTPPGDKSFYNAPPRPPPFLDQVLR